MNRLRSVFVLFLALTSGSALEARAGSGSQAHDCAADLGVLLARFDQAIVAKDSAAVMALCHSADAAAANRLAQRYLGWRALDTLACRTRLGPVSCAGARAEAPVYRELEWREYGRTQVSTQWSTARFRREGNAWAIESEEDRDYARVRSTDLTVRLDPEAGMLEGTATLRLGIERPGENNLLLALNRGLEVTALRGADGDSMQFTRNADAIVIPLGGVARSGDSLAVRVEFAGKPFNESAENNYSQFNVGPDGSFASWVTEWYPRVAGSASKSRGRITYDIPAGLTVASSGRPAERTTHGDRQRQTFAVDHPLDFSFAAARYLHRERVVDGVTVGVYLLTGDESKAQRYLDASARALRSSRDRYGMYPYDCYAVVEIPSSATGSLGGSSEQGMNLFPTGILPDSTVPLALLAHEIGHSWWGNLVELDGSLAEAMAQASAALCLRDIEGEATMRHFLVYGQPELPGQSQRGYFERFAGRPGDRPLGARPLGGQDRALLHDLCDTKGYVVLDMMRDLIGERAYVEGQRAVIRAFAGRRAGLHDLQAAWEKASGRKLDRFVEQWFYRTGAPDLALRNTVETAGRRFRVRGRIVQRDEPYDLKVEVVVVLPNGTRVEHVDLTGAETAFSIVVPARPRAVLLDPDHKVLRWCDEFRADGFLRRAMRLRGDGREADALDTLNAALSADPAESPARYELGLLHQTAGRLENAAAAYQEVAWSFDRYPAYSPSVAWSFLHLGEVSDLLGRRDSAVAAYRRVLDLPDESGSRKEASRYLQSPYVPPAGAPDPEVLGEFAGTYASSVVGVLTVSAKAKGSLQIEQAGTPPSALQWSEGTRFDLVSMPGTSVEFVEVAGGHARAMVVRIGSRELRMERQQ